VSASELGSKAARKAERKRLQNRLVRRSIKTLTVRARSSISAGEEAAYEKVKLAISRIDKAVNKGVIHRNKGARLKSRLMKQLGKK